MVYLWCLHTINKYEDGHRVSKNDGITKLVVIRMLIEAEHVFESIGFDGWNINRKEVTTYRKRSFRWRQGNIRVGQWRRSDESLHIKWCWEGWNDHCHLHILNGKGGGRSCYTQWGEFLKHDKKPAGKHITLDLPWFKTIHFIYNLRAISFGKCNQNLTDLYNKLWEWNY